MEKITTLNNCSNWKRFLFFHQDKPKYKVLLPDGDEVLYLSSYTIYNLQEGESSLCSTTRAQCKEGAANNVFDFSQSEYSSTEIIEFFFLVTFPKDVVSIADPSDSIMLVHLYAPKMMKNILGDINWQITIEHKNKEELRYIWKIARLCELAGIYFAQMSRYRMVGLLERFPHTLWEFDNSVDVGRFIEAENPKCMSPDLLKVIECWKRGDKYGLYEIEEKPEIKSLMITNDEGISLLRINTVAQKLNLAFDEDQLMICEKFVSKKYVNTRGTTPPKVKCNIDGRIVTINHFNERDYDIIVKGINKFLKTKSA